MSCIGAHCGSPQRPVAVSNGALPHRRIELTHRKIDARISRRFIHHTNEGWPLLPVTQHHQAVDRIGAWIVQGRYEPGATLPTEPELGAALGVSRTVVREAIKALAAKGMVVTRTRIGTRVTPQSEWRLFDPAVIGWTLDRPVDEAFVADLMEIRLAIEPVAAKLAAERRTAADVARIGAAYEAMARAVEGAGDYTSADLAFHTALIAASGNRFLVQMEPIVAGILRMSFSLSTENMEEARGSLPDHRLLFEAIRDRDGEGARARLARIIELAGEDIMRHLRERREKAA